MGGVPVEIALVVLSDIGSGLILPEQRSDDMSEWQTCVLLSRFQQERGSMRTSGCSE